MESIIKTLEQLRDGRKFAFNPDNVEKMHDGAGVIVLWNRDGQALRVVDVWPSVRSELNGILVGDYLMGDFSKHGSLDSFSVAWEMDSGHREVLARAARLEFGELVAD